MGHNSHTDTTTQNPRMVVMTLALFFVMSAMGHFAFVVKAGHHEVSAEHNTQPHSEKAEPRDTKDKPGHTTDDTPQQDRVPAKKSGKH